MTERRWDVVVVGGGPAGLSAALWLARYRRRVVVVDGGRPRNEAAWAVHGFPGLEDPAPRELRGVIRSQADAAGAAFEEGTIVSIEGEKDRFAVTADSGTRRLARRVLLAYGRQDRVPDVRGLAPLYGTSVFHCPDCDGPSVQDLTVAVLGHDRPAAALALYLLTWARNTLLLTDGRDPDLSDDARAILEEHGVTVRREPVRRLVGRDGHLQRVDTEGDPVPADALFFHWGSEPASALGPASGCESSADGDLVVDPSLQTSVPGIYAAGDIIGHPHLAVSAAAGGVRAALAVHRSLLPDAFDL